MKQLINAKTIARIQEILESEMQTACVVYRAGTAAADGLGGFTNATTVTVETTICFIGDLGSSTQEREIAAQNTESVLFAFRMPHNSAVKKNHWIVADGLTYRVLGFADSDANVYKKVIVKLDR